MPLESSAKRSDAYPAKRVGFVALAVVFAGVAAFHAVALVRPEIAPPSPPWRHALFAAINTVVAVGMVARPRGFVFAFAALTAQQLVSHGSAAWSAWTEERRVDVVSLLVVIAMPVVLVALAIDARQLDARRTSARPLP